MDNFPLSIDNEFREVPSYIIFIIPFISENTHNTREEKRFIQQLETENLYTFGKATQFYNLEAFKNRVRQVSKRFKRKDGRILMCFTPTALDLSANRMRNPIVMDLNCRLAEFLDRLFRVEKNEFSQKDVVYGFSRGIFLIYCISGDDTYIHRLLNAISNECFRMVNEEKIKIWVQPFYGINRLPKDASITRAIEDTLIARDISEKNIESFTYFRESFRKEEGNVSS